MIKRYFIIQGLVKKRKGIIIRELQGKRERNQTNYSYKGKG